MVEERTDDLIVSTLVFWAVQTVFGELVQKFVPRKHVACIQELRFLWEETGPRRLERASTESTFLWKVVLRLV